MPVAPTSRVRDFSKALFGNSYRLELLAIISEVDGPFYARQIAKRMGIADNLVTSQLGRFCELGLLEKRTASPHVLYTRQPSSIWQMAAELRTELGGESAEESDHVHASSAEYDVEFVAPLASTGNRADRIPEIDLVVESVVEGFLSSGTPALEGGERPRRLAAYDRLFKRASELPDFSQLVPFVHRQLITTGRLPEPTALQVRAVNLDASIGHAGGGHGRRKRAGLVAVAVRNAAPPRGTGWATVSREHASEQDQSDRDRTQAERPLRQLLEALAAAHPGIPIVIDHLVGTQIVDHVDPLRSWDADSALWREWHKRGAFLLFRRPTPSALLHFSSVPVSGGLQVRKRDIGNERTIEITDWFGEGSYYSTSTLVSCETAARAISTIEEQRNDVETYTQRLRGSGGNAQTASAIAVRAACIQITDLLVEADVPDVPREAIVSAQRACLTK